MSDISVDTDNSQQERSTIKGIKTSDTDTKRINIEIRFETTGEKENSYSKSRMIAKTCTMFCREST